MDQIQAHRLHDSSDVFMAYLAQHLKEDVNISRFPSLDSVSDILLHTPNDQWSVRRCRTEGDISCISPVSSFRDDFGHAAAETYLVTKLAFTLLKCLGIGYRWLTKLGALGLYATFLLPGFIQVGYYYFFDKRIHRSIVYGPKPRNRLDLYLPMNCDSPKPVIVFITGGAWIIGYKAWGSLLGLQLVEKNVIVACIDYRNFPQGSVSDMVEDVIQGISFICENVASYGGDPNRLYLAGQSAGAHLAACAVVEQAIKESSFDKGLAATGNTEGFTEGLSSELRWRASQFRAYFGISGGYNLKSLVDHFHNRGLYRSLFLSIMEGEQSLLRYSPELRVQCIAENARSLLPPFFLLHGTADISIPSRASTSFANVLASMDVQVTTKLYEGKTHTDVFLQDPLRGGHDVLLKDILQVVHSGDKEGRLVNARPRLVPEFLLQLARRISPF